MPAAGIRRLALWAMGMGSATGTLCGAALLTVEPIGLLLLLCIGGASGVATGWLAAWAATRWSLRGF